MVDIIFNLVVILQASSIALGVGSSTVVIASFITALSDGTIDESERRMLGVIYWSLRVAMVGIVLTTGYLAFVDPTFLDPVEIFVWILVAILFINALAMTKHWISSKIGPALQAATWYTLGFLVTIHMFELFALSGIGFSILYIADIVIALALVNGIITWLKKRKTR